MKVYSAKHTKLSGLEQQYQNYARLQEALLVYLQKTVEAVDDLNRSLNQLADSEGLGSIEWLNGDPRLVFFASVDPLRSGYNRSEVRTAFKHALSDMIKTVKRLGYSVEFRKVKAKNPGYLSERAVWQLTKAPNPQIETSAVPDDELSDPVEEEAS